MRATINKVFSKMPNSEQNVQECDATDDHSSNIAGFKKNTVLNIVQINKIISHFI